MDFKQIFGLSFFLNKHFLSNNSLTVWFCLFLKSSLIENILTCLYMKKILSTRWADQQKVIISLTIPLYLQRIYFLPRITAIDSRLIFPCSESCNHLDYRCSLCIRIYPLPMWFLSVYFHFLFLKLYAECCLLCCLFCIPSTFLSTSFYWPRGGILWAFTSIILVLSDHARASSSNFWTVHVKS